MKGYIRKRGKTYSYTVDIGRDPLTGKRKQRTKSGFKTKKEAESALNELIYELDKGIWIQPQNVLFKDFANEWFSNHKFKLRDTTAEQYESKVKNYIVPFFGESKVIDIKPIHAQAFSKYLLEQGLNHNTAHKAYSIAKMVFKHAVDLELITKNPLMNVSVIKQEKPAINTWSFEELEKFLSVAKTESNFYHNFFALAAYTGMRKGEVLGLRRLDIDFNNNRIVIKQSVKETKEGVSIGQLKTPSSYRQISIDAFIVSVLKEQINKNNEMKLKYGKDYKDNGLIFCYENGEPFRPSSLNRPFSRYSKLAELTQIRIHDLRHTHATLLLEMGVNPKVVADRLGHGSVKITLDTYSHTSLALQSDVANMFSQKIRIK